MTTTFEKKDDALCCRCGTQVHESCVSGNLTCGREEASRYESTSCRYCHKFDRHLITPCSCQGVAKYVHLSCLNKNQPATVDPRDGICCSDCGRQYTLEATHSLTTHQTLALCCFLCFETLWGLKLLYNFGLLSCFPGVLACTAVIVAVGLYLEPESICSSVKGGPLVTGHMYGADPIGAIFAVMFIGCFVMLVECLGTSCFVIGKYLKQFNQRHLFHQKPPYQQVTNLRR